MCVVRAGGGGTGVRRGGRGFVLLWWGGVEGVPDGCGVKRLV